MPMWTHNDNSFGCLYLVGGDIPFLWTFPPWTERRSVWHIWLQGVMLGNWKAAVGKLDGGQSQCKYRYGNTQIVILTAATWIYECFIYWPCSASKHVVKPSIIKKWIWPYWHPKHQHHQPLASRDIVFAPETFVCVQWWHLEMAQ